MIYWLKQARVFALLVAIGCVGSSSSGDESLRVQVSDPEVASSELPEELPLVSLERITQLKQAAASADASQKIGLFADFSLHSGKKRFFVVDLETRHVLESGLVAHGHCQESEPGVRFSNEPGSNCSSEGKYRIGKSYFGTFGLAFKLHGLDETNSKAFERFVVMHAHPCVYDEETEYEICESEGCPTLSPAMLETTQAWMDTVSRPVLLWVYQSQQPSSDKAPVAG